MAEFALGLLKADTRYPYRPHCEQHTLARMAYETLGVFRRASDSSRTAPRAVSLSA